MMNPMVSVVLGSYNRCSFLKAALESARANGMDFPYEIIVVDGGSNDGSLKYLAAQKDIVTIIQHNRGEFRGTKVERRSWGHFMNLGFKAAQGKYILMISDDCLLIPNSIKNGVDLFEKLLAAGQKIGAVAFYWRNWPQQKDYWVGLTLGSKMFVNHGLFLRSALAEVGWVDEETFHFYHADGDLCLKLWHNGYGVVDCPTAFVEHCEGVNASRVPNEVDWAKYLTKWEGIFYQPQKNNIGDWIHLSHVDHHQTYKHFPFWYRLDVQRRKYLRGRGKFLE